MSKNLKCCIHIPTNSNNLPVKIFSAAPNSINDIIHKIVETEEDDDDDSENEYEDGDSNTDYGDSD